MNNSKIIMSTLSGMLLAAGLLTGTSAFAKPAYIDAYTINGAYYLSSSVVSGDIAIERLSNNVFSVSDQASGGGTFSVTVGVDNNRQCTLTIIDADFQVPRMVTNSCKGGYSVKSFKAGYNNVQIDIKHKK